MRSVFGTVRLAFIYSLLSLAPLLAASDKEPVTLLGIDVLETQGFVPLAGKQVGLITNQTGVDSRGRSTADILAKAPNVKLVALFSPEHGIRGTHEHGEAVGDMIDSRLHLPVYSLYGSVQKPA